MPRYHISRKTGKPGVCKATVCPFASETDHYDSREEALFYYEQEMESKMFPSFDEGSINVTQLPTEMRRSDDEVVIPKGLYVIGDPSMTVGIDAKAWHDWFNTISQERGSFARGAVGAAYNNYPVIALPSHLGPGVYRDNFNRNFEMPSSTLGVVPVALLKKMGVTDEEINACGTVVSFDKPTSVTGDGKTLRVGDNFVLDATQPMDAEASLN